MQFSTVYRFVSFQGKIPRTYNLLFFSCDVFINLLAVKNS